LRSAVERLLIENGVSREVARALASHGHSPEEWERHFLSQQNDFRWRQEGDRLVFNDFVRLFQAAEVNRVLLLVDEIEKIVVPQNSHERRTFVDDLRRFFIDGPYQSVYARLYSLLLTIHPYIQELWTPHWQVAGLDRVCPLSGGIAREYTVYFYPLDAEEAAVPLVLTYLDHFRTSADQKGKLHPFDRNAVVEALRLAGGVPGPMLTLLRLVLEKAINQDWDTINEEQIRAVYEYEIPAEPSKQDEIGALSPLRTDLLGEG
jgi:hypothetical protein